MLIVGLGGTGRPRSTSERALRICLANAESLGAETLFLGADALDLPMYVPERAGRTPEAERLVDAVRRADGVILAAAGYHGGMSGVLKNALDYLEDLRDDARPYLDGRAVGCIVCASGWQATTTTLVGMRLTIHALRGWPTPLGVVLNSAEPVWGVDGSLVDQRLTLQLEILASQVVGFASMAAAHDAVAAHTTAGR
jgi:FMN reductase